MSPYTRLFDTLDDALTQFIQKVDTQTLSAKTTGTWTVKDTLCHIVFWHEYYAKQYAALATGKTPVIFKSRGGATRNQDGVNTLNHLSKTKLLIMLQRAQKNLRKSILVHGVSYMDYTDHKRYTTEEFLDVIARHIMRHAEQVQKATKK